MDKVPTSTFDVWTLLFCGIACVGLFYSVKLLTVRGKYKMDLILGVYLLLQSIMLLEYVLFWSHLIFSFHIFADISLLFPLLFGPLLLIYIDRSFGKMNHIEMYWIHFIPFLFLFILKFPFYVSDPQLKFFHTRDIMFGSYFEFYPWVKILHLAIYCVFLFVRISNTSGIGHMRKWARWIIAFFALNVLFLLVHQTLVQTSTLTPQLDYYVSFAPCITIFFIAWYGKGYEAVADGIGILNSLKKVNEPRANFENDLIIDSVKGSRNAKYRNSGLPNSLKMELARDLEDLMQEQQLYKQNDLKLDTLAQKLGTTKHFISQVINEVHKVNFFEYVNLKRIDEAKQLLRSKTRKELNIIEIAYEVGFNSKGTFNSVFKKFTGLTPSEFSRQSTQFLEINSN